MDNFLFALGEMKRRLQQEEKMVQHAFLFCLFMVCYGIISFLADVFGPLLGAAL